MTCKVPALARAFGLEEGPLPTGIVMTTPSSVTREQGRYVAQAVSLAVLLRDLGALAAREYANEMSAANLRPADFADHPGIPQMLRRRLIEILQKEPEHFDSAFAEQLRARG